MSRARHLGGLTSGGLGATDIGNKQAIGGIAREFYRRVWEHYQRGEAWQFQPRAEFVSERQESGEQTMWTFEPHVAEQIMQALVREAGVPVVFNERLDLKHGVSKEGTDIVAIHMESGQTFRGRRFIDATYEGDLLAAAGVSFHVGREAREVYDESLNGVQTAQGGLSPAAARCRPVCEAGRSDQRTPARCSARPAGQGRERRPARAGVLLPHVYHRLSREPHAVRETRRL